ncbi:hypothetical protein [uncultured Winogradskyella sp.]|uniref:hypothetical protein n=1 Tax=uncultured Winogradskyella sp. TaxID=395353 RepID=UPI003518D988
MKKLYLLSIVFLAFTTTNAQKNELSNKEAKNLQQEKCFNASKSMLLSKRYKFSVQDFVNGHSIPGNITINGSTAFINMRDWPMQFSSKGYGGKNLALYYKSDITDYKFKINEIEQKFDLEFVTNFDGERIQFSFDIDACSVAYVAVQSDRRVDGGPIGGFIRPLD